MKILRVNIGQQTLPIMLSIQAVKHVASLAIVLCLAACTNYEYHETKQVNIKRVSEADEKLIEEQHLL